MSKSNNKVKSGRRAPVVKRDVPLSNPAEKADSVTDLSDITQFIQDQELSMDKDVESLLKERLVLPIEGGGKKGNKKKNKQRQFELENSEGQQEDPSDAAASMEETLELQAYLESVRSKNPEVNDNNASVNVNANITQKVYVNRTEALQERLQDFRTDDRLPWVETMCVTCPFASEIPDVNDDLARELAFYKQALDAVVQGRTRVLKAGIPFSRPDDFFAEMIKTDAHMARIRQRLLDEASALDASEKARQLRDAKKYGKKVQQQKLIARQQEKSATLEKVSIARRKRDASGLDLDDETGTGKHGFGASEDFGVTTEGSGSQRGKDRPSSAHRKRQKKDEKYGFGGSKRGSKSNTRDSTDDIRGFSHKKMKSGAKPAGKKARHRK